MSDAPDHIPDPPKPSPPVEPDEDINPEDITYVP